MDAPAPRFERLRELGRGTTGSVALARMLEPYGELQAGTEIAIKTLLPHLAKDPAARALLEAEQRAASEASDPSLVRVLFRGEDAKGPYLAMPFVPGRSLRELQQERGRLPEPLLRNLGRQIAGALAALHRAGYTHGDLKPENIRMDEHGRAVLLDLAFASLRQDQDLGHWVGANPGSLPYLSPERAQGARAQPAADVFALGIVLFELATGLHPFDEESQQRFEAARQRERVQQLPGHSTGELLRRSVETPGADRLLAALATARFRPPSRFNPALAPFFDQLLEELLMRDARRRPEAGECAARFAEGESGSWWRSLTLSGRRARKEREAQHLTPLVGRDRELGLLERALEHSWRSAVGPGGVVWLEGAPGSGKSRLVGALAQRASVREPYGLYLYGRCSELEESRPLGPLVMLLHRWLEVPRGSAIGQRERELLERLVPPREAQVLLEGLDPAFHGAASGSLEVAFSVWFEALARQAPLLVFLDDIQHAGKGTLSTLMRLCARVSRMRLLLVLGLRPEPAAAGLERQGLPRLVERLGSLQREGLAFLRLELQPLDEAAVRELVTKMFHHSAPRLRIAHVLWLRSRGSAGLLSEILRGLLQRAEARPVSEDDTALVLNIAPEKLPLPDSLQTSISKRYKELATEQRLWLGRLSVVGGRISTDFLVRAFPPAEPAEIDAVLDELVRSFWIVPAGARYRFARPALREAVYRSLSEERRRRIHAAAAKALAGVPGETLSLADALQRAFHLRAAERHAELLRLLRPLLPALARRGQTQRVHSLAHWGLEALERLPGGELEARLRLEFLELGADAANRLGERERERELLDKLAELQFDAENDPLAAARIYLLHGRYAAGTGQYGLARGMLRNAVELARKSLERKDDPSELLSEALRRLALVQSQVGELEEGRVLAKQAIAHAVGGVSTAFCHLARATIEVLEERLEAGLAEVESALSWLRHSQGGQRLTALCVAQLLRARIFRSGGRQARALAAAMRALDLAQQAGERRLEAEAATRLGGLLLDLDRPEEAEARLRDAQLIADEIEDRRGQTLARLWLAILLWERDDPEALGAIHRATDMAREIGFYRAEAVGLSIRARIERQSGNLPLALELSARAMEVLERRGAELSDRIVISATRALMLYSAGEHKRAKELSGELRKRIHRDSERIEHAGLRSGLLAYSRRLLAAVLSPDGPVYPRSRVVAAALSADRAAPRALPEAELVELPDLPELQLDEDG